MQKALCWTLLEIDSWTILQLDYKENRSWEKLILFINHCWSLAGIRSRVTRGVLGIGALADKESLKSNDR